MLGRENKCTAANAKRAGLDNVLAVNDSVTNCAVQKFGENTDLLPPFCARQIVINIMS